MNEIETESILEELKILVADKFQVVSYKWLSRNFEVSSSLAKRLLQDFVETHGGEIEVVYTLSGWQKSDPPSYLIQLVSQPKLEEAKKQYNGNCSVQVYSVQTCIPKDPAALWNSEFVQAEDLFNQPSTVDNCLFDNRYSGVHNSFVKCIDSRIPQPSVANSATKNVAAASSENVKVQHPSPKMADGHPLIGGVKEVKMENKRKISQGDEEGTASRSRGSLTNLWDLATAKSKPVSASSKIILNPPVTSEAQIRALEEQEDRSSDDHRNSSRGGGGGNAKRKAVFDYSDDEDEEVTSLASPNPPKEVGSLEQGTSAIEKKTDKAPRNDDVKEDESASAALISVTRRKVLKTQIDDHGREVTEVVWEVETEANKGDDGSKEITRSAPSKRSPAIMNSCHTTSGASRGRTKKGGYKDQKQGNILSFFKKF